MKNIKDLLLEIKSIPQLVGVAIYKGVTQKEMDVKYVTEKLIDNYNVRDVIKNVIYDDNLILGSDLYGAYMIPNDKNEKGDLHLKTYIPSNNQFEMEIYILTILLHEIRHAQQYKLELYDFKDYKEINEFKTEEEYMQQNIEKDAVEFSKKEFVKNIKYLYK